MDMRNFPFYLGMLAASVLIFSACKKEESEVCHTSITTVNNSDQAIYVGISELSYPDTTFVGESPAEDPVHTLIASQQANANTLYSPALCWEKRIPRISSGVLSVYVFDAYTIDSIPWDTVIAQQRYAARYDLSLEDLKTQNWTLIYPKERGQ
jgi:hypothetical protein